MLIEWNQALFARHGFPIFFIEQGKLLSSKKVGWNSLNLFSNEKFDIS